MLAVGRIRRQKKGLMYQYICKNCNRKWKQESANRKQCARCGSANIQVFGIKQSAQQSFAADASPDRPLDEHEFNAWDDDPGLY